jgi:hypothetical protein
VAATLRRAGLPVRLWNGLGGTTDGRGGALVEVDPIADGAGGVFVWWDLPDELALPAHEALLCGQIDHPAVKRSGQTVSIMIDAMTRLLIEEQFITEDAAIVNDMRALQIHVKSRVALDPPNSSLSGRPGGPRVTGGQPGVVVPEW